MRLARMRGSLTAPNSPVQDRALEYLLLDERQQKERLRLDEFKRALMVSSVTMERAHTFFPEYFPRDAFTEAQKDDGTYDIDAVDDAKVDWETPRDHYTDDEISAWIAERERGSVTAADLDDGWK